MSDGNLNDNYYSNGVRVGGNVGSLKMGTSTYNKFCAWSGTQQSGSVLGYALPGGGWSNTTYGGAQSVYLRTSTTC